MMAKLVLVDSNNLLVRGMKAAERRPLSAGGIPTAAVMIYINSLTRHLREEAPDQVMVCWDGGRSAYRTERSAGTYKAHRAEQQDRDDPEGPFAQAKRFLAVANVPQVERAGWEADDLIAAYASMHQDAGETVIISSDHDLLQLLWMPNTTQAKVASGDSATDRWDAGRVRAEFDVPEPDHLAWVMALAGDPGDGVPGLPGIGPVKAVKMLRAVDWSWPALLDSLDPERRAVVEMSLDLVDLCRFAEHDRLAATLPRPVAFRPTRPGDVLYDALTAFLDRYELARIQASLNASSLWPPRSPARQDAG